MGQYAACLYKLETDKLECIWSTLRKTTETVNNFKNIINSRRSRNQYKQKKTRYNKVNGQTSKNIPNSVSGISRPDDSEAFTSSNAWSVSTPIAKHWQAKQRKIQTRRAQQGALQEAIAHSTHPKLPQLKKGPIKELSQLHSDLLNRKEIKKMKTISLFSYA